MHIFAGTYVHTWWSCICTDLLALTCTHGGHLSAHSACIEMIVKDLFSADVLSPLLLSACARSMHRNDSKGAHACRRICAHTSTHTNTHTHLYTQAAAMDGRHPQHAGALQLDAAVQRRLPRTHSGNGLYESGGLEGSGGAGTQCLAISSFMNLS